MLAKMLLMLVFVPIFVAMGAIAKERLWMSILLALFGGMLLFMMVPMITPLDAGAMNVLMCLAGGLLFTVALGKGSSAILAHENLVYGTTGT